jgi:hypothetical protein
MSVARVAIGAALISVPPLATDMWLGRKGMTAPARLLSRALGSRDLAIGAGALWSLAGRSPLHPWLVAGVVADGTDLVATLLHRKDLPDTAVPLVIATAGAGVAMGAYGLSAGDQ